MRAAVFRPSTGSGLRPSTVSGLRPSTGSELRPSTSSGLRHTARMAMYKKVDNAGQLATNASVSPRNGFVDVYCVETPKRLNSLAAHPDMIRLVVFDLDGTLVDSSHDIAKATNALVEELGGAPLAHDAVVSMVGEGAAVLVRRALTAAASTRPRQARSIASWPLRRAAADATRPYQGMIEALRGTCSETSPGGADEQAGAANARDSEGLGRCGILWRRHRRRLARTAANPIPPACCDLAAARRCHAGRDADGRRLARRSGDRAPRRHADLPGAVWVRLSLRRNRFSRRRSLRRRAVGVPADRVNLARGPAEAEAPARAAHLELRATPAREVPLPLGLRKLLDRIAQHRPRHALVACLQGSARSAAPSRLPTSRSIHPTAL